MATVTSKPEMTCPAPPESRWSVAIFSSRESIDTLASSIDAVLTAVSDTPAVVDVIVNGNRSLADAAARFAQTSPVAGSEPTIIRTWFLEVADKAYAWNTYVHEIWEGADLAYFVDGYVRVMPDAFALIANGLSCAPDKLAASGIPTVGRSSKALRKQMLKTGGIHGNLYMLRGEVLKQLCVRGFRLPIGIYRNDALLGAVICFGLNPAKNGWDRRRIYVHPHATWVNPTLAWWRLGDLWRHGKKIMRQAQGILENHAVRDSLAFRKRPPETLPRTVSDLVLTWLRANPAQAARVFLRNPLCLFAANNVRARGDLSSVAGKRILCGQVEIPGQGTSLRER